LAIITSEAWSHFLLSLTTPFSAGEEKRLVDY
jgi:hypothetical protein